MIRMVQIGIDHPHAAAYRGTLALLRNRVDVVGFVRRPSDPRGVDLGPFADVPIFDSLDDLLNTVTPDAAQVMLWNNEMGLALTALAREGIHLWAEKPVARRAADLAPVAELVKSKNLVFTAGYQSRFYPTTRYVRELIADGLLGSLTFAHMTTATTTVRLRNPAGPTGHLFDEVASGGGIFHWLGCHMVDLLLSITQARPAAVQAMTATAGEEAVEVEDVTAVTVQFAEGWLASLNYGYLLPTKEVSPFGDDAPEPAVYGQQGWVRWNSATDVARSYTEDPRARDSPWQMQRFATPQPGGYGHAALQAMGNFLDAIAGTSAPVYSVEQAMLVLQIIEAAYESAQGAGVTTIPASMAGAYAN